MSIHAEYLEYLTLDGAIKRYGDLPVEEFAEYEAIVDSREMDILRRIHHELSVIHQAGFPDYFLIVYDLMRFCRENRIPVGPGRGSVCGSVVAYCLFITDVDPLVFGIPFERFLHLDRVALPDIDLDVCQARRKEVIQYLHDKYGDQNVAQIITFGTMMAKGVTRDVCRVLHVDDHILGKKSNTIGDRIASTIPEGSGADQIKLEEFIETEEGKPVKNELERLNIVYEGRKIHVLDQILRLEGLKRHGSVHAAGVVVADRPLFEIAPLYRRNQTADVQIQYDYIDAEKAGLLKLDVLGLRTITVLGDIEQMIQKKDETFSLRSIPLYDEKTFSLLQDGDTVGVFQLEGEGITGALRGIIPDRFDDIIAILALYRPGPMEQIGSYVHRKHGEERIHYAHPDLEPVLERTYGLMVFQEQVMNIARTMAGYSPGEADMFRKAIGKKLPTLIAEQIEEFKTRAKKNGYDHEVVDGIGDQIYNFGRYGFNLGHATGYAFITYWTAYCKANYPVEFYAATLNSLLTNIDKMSVVLNDARKHNIKILTPNINKSDRGFTLAGPDSIRFGLEAIRSVGHAIVTDILEERDEWIKNEYTRERVTRTRESGETYKASVKVTNRVRNLPREYDSFSDFCSRLPGVPINVKKALVMAGAFGESIDRRRALYSVADRINSATKKKGTLTEDQEERIIADAKTELSELDILRGERDVMGFYVSKHPLEHYEDWLALYDAKYMHESFLRLPGKMNIAGIVTGIRTHSSKRGMMAWISVENGLRDMPDITVFNDVWKTIEDRIKKDSIVIVYGRRTKHERYGIGFIAENVVIFEEGKVPGTTMLVMCDARTADEVIDTILAHSDIKKRHGTFRMLVGIEEHGSIAILRTDRYLSATGNALRGVIEASRGTARIDPLIGSPISLSNSKTITWIPTAYVGRGKTRRPIWETETVRHIIESLGGRITSTYKHWNAK